MIGLDYDVSMTTTDVTFERAGRGGGGRSRRGVTIGVVAAALLVAGVVAVSRSQPRAETASPTAVAQTTPTTPAPTATTEAETSTSPTTTLPKRTSLGTAPLLGEPTGLELWFQGSLVVSGSSGQERVYRLDLDRAVLEDVASKLYFDGPFSDSIVLDDGFLAYGNRLTGVKRDGSPMTLVATPEAQIIGAGADGMWIRPFNNSGSQPAVRHIAFDGRSLGELKEPADSYVQQSLGNDRFLLSAPSGRSYLLHADTGAITPLIGSVVAMARESDAYLTTVCDDQAVCHAEYHGANGLVRTTSLTPAGYDGSRPVLSPDGTWMVSQAIVRERDGAIRVDSGMVAPTTIENLVTGESIAVGKVPIAFGISGIDPMVAWTADGSWLLLATEGGLAAWRPGLTSPIVLPVALGSNPIAALAVGPAPTT
jgi:hypothetical protein